MPKRQAVIGRSFGVGAGARSREEPGAACLVPGIPGGGSPGAGLRLGAQSVEAFQGHNLLVEDQAELPGRVVRDGFESWAGLRARNFPFEARHGAVGDAAGIDESEVAQIGGDVEGESVRGDAAGDVNADGGDLALALRWAALWTALWSVRLVVRRRCPTEARTRRRSSRRCVRPARQTRRRAGSAPLPSGGRSRPGRGGCRWRLRRLRRSKMG